MPTLESPRFEDLACEDHRPFYAEILPGALGYQKATGRSNAFAYLVEGRIWGNHIDARWHPGRCKVASCLEFYHKLRRILLEGMADADRRKPAYKGKWWYDSQTRCHHPHGKTRNGAPPYRGECRDCNANKLEEWTANSRVSDPHRLGERGWCARIVA